MTLIFRTISESVNLQIKIGLARRAAAEPFTDLS